MTETYNNVPIPAGWFRVRTGVIDFGDRVLDENGEWIDLPFRYAREKGGVGMFCCVIRKVPKSEETAGKVCVVNVRDFKSTLLPVRRDRVLPFIYVGRAVPAYGLKAHPLGNPYKLTKKWPTAKDKAECIEWYRHWLTAQSDLLKHLAEQVKETGLPLACWCGSFPEDPGLLCHAVVLAKAVQKIIDGVDVESDLEAT